MAEEQTGQERTEEPTERRLTEARRKGQVPRSRELSTLLVTLSGALALWVSGSYGINGIVEIMTTSFSVEGDLLKEPALLPIHLMGMILNAVLLIVPFLVVTLLATFIAPASMGGLIFSTESLTFKLDKLDPVKGIGRMFSLKSLVELVKTILKFLLLLGAAVLIYKAVEREVLGLGTLPLEDGLKRSATILAWALVAMAATMILIAAIDVPFQLFEHNKQLKMTRQEIKDEMKESDGRPEVKSRIRQLQREMSQQRMMQDVPTADVIITNPTHFSVALKYDQGGNAAPTVIAKGQDYMALQIRHIARINDIVIYEEPPLARALYASTEVGQEIPSKLFLAVARVLAYVYHLRRAMPTDYVPRPDPIDLPEEYRDVMREDFNNGK